MPNNYVPILPLRNTVIFPGISQMVRVGRDRSVRALLHAQKYGFWIVASQQKNPDPNAAKDVVVDPQDVHHMGTLCRIESMKGSKESGYQVVLRGFNRCELEDIRLNADPKVGGFLESLTIELSETNDMDPPTEKAMLDSLKSIARDILKLIPGNTDHLSEILTGVEDLSYLTALCAGNIDLEVAEKQKILEMTNLRERSLYIMNLLKSLKESILIQAEIRGKLHQKLGQAQRQTILREQLRTIKEELGEDGEGASVEEKLRNKIMEAHMPEDVQKMALSELNRFSEVGTQSPESHIIRNYLELLTALPWSKSSEEKDIDLEEVRKVLDADHFGLDPVKKRIVQHLAVLKLKKDMRGSILLFVGPPGVGKTSLGESIAKVMGKKFVRVSFGGVRDDAEVRGHRRTYIGAMPGRIIQGLKKAGENNPVFLLDEIDKLSRAFNGDPAAALLEVLDPEQNANFLDHYLDVGFDLSKVFFIATANSLEGIPGPLLDRMEVIELTGYTTAEKMHIAKGHLIPKQLKEHGMTADMISISDEALLRLISSYTREAGVRDLQRKIASLLRASSERIVASKSLPVRIEAADLEELVGSERFQNEVAEIQTEPGVATGLAWTPVGGDILFIESTAMPGKGELTITGQLGEVMKESAQIALSLVRSNLSKFGVTIDRTKTDLHLHVPAGAIPKDGPSAGVTMLTSMASLLTGRPVKAKMAMTGEITLRGIVMPVGGIKEKVIAAHRAGIREIILPARNQKDLKDVPKEVRDQLKFHLVENVREVIYLALGLEVNTELPHLDKPTPPPNQGIAF